MTNKPLYLICIILVLLVRTQTDQMEDSFDKVTIEVVLFFIAIVLCYFSYKESVKGG